MTNSVPVPWVEKQLRGTRVWMQSDAAGNPVLGEDERVEMCIGRVASPYRASPGTWIASPMPSRLTTHCAGGQAGAWGDGKADSGQRAASPSKRAPGAQRAKLSPEAAAGWYIFYTDGACTGNPGPMGIGVVIPTRPVLK